MADSKQEVNQYENGNGAAYTKGSKKRACARHCKRFWWVHLIIFLIGIVLIVVIA